MALSITQLLEQYGAYYLGDGGATNRQRLISRLYQVSKTAGFFLPKPTKDTQYRITLALLKSVIQAFQSRWTPKGNLALDPKIVPLHHLKIDIEEIPSELEETWAGFLTQLGMTSDMSIDRLAVEKWPFVRWYIEEHLLASRDNDVENNEIFWGEFITPTPGTANPDGANMDGIRKKLLTRRDAVTPLVNTVLTGALETDPVDFVEQIEKYIGDARAAKPVLANYPLTVFLNLQLEERYRKGMRKLYGKDNDIVTPEQFRTVLDKNANVVGLPSMNSNPRDPGTSTDLIWSTFAENRIRPFRFSPDTVMAKSGANPRALQIFTDWYLAVDFVHDDMVFVNELDSLTPES